MKMQEKLIEYLSQNVTERRYELINNNAELRTRYITVVLEDIFQPQNASAVLRTCDCFGVQDVHIIENENEYNINPEVVMGSTKWLNLNKYNEEKNNTVATIKKLKEQGYRIVATTPHTNDVNLEELDLSKGKIALMFGSEQPGLSNLALEHADEFMKIPMVGFTESFNISVSAAISLHHLTHKLRNSDINWQLSKEEMNELKLNWLRTTIKKSDLIEEKFHQEQALNSI